MLFILVALCYSDSLRVHAIGRRRFVVTVVAAETFQCLRDSPRDGIPHGDHRHESARSDRRPRARVVFARRYHFPAVAAKAHAVLLRVGVYLFNSASTPPGQLRARWAPQPIGSTTSTTIDPHCKHFEQFAIAGT
jgi:hypothetical protein